MPPAGKRKANAMLDRIEKMAKQSEFDEERKKSDKYEVERKEYFESARAMFEESEKKETKEQYFDRLLKESTSLDKVLEFLKFRKQADKLLPNLREEMIKLVKKELEIDKALENLSLESNIATEEGTPLLEALGSLWCGHVNSAIDIHLARCKTVFQKNIHRRNNNRWNGNSVE